MHYQTVPNVLDALNDYREGVIAAICEIFDDSTIQLTRQACSSGGGPQYERFLLGVLVYKFWATIIFFLMRHVQHWESEEPGYENVNSDKLGTTESSYAIFSLLHVQATCQSFLMKSSLQDYTETYEFK